MVRWLLIKSVVLLFRPVAFILLRLMCHKPLKVGTVQCYGPSAFLAQCARALATLKELDPDVYRRLTEIKSYVFWFHSTDVRDNRFNRVYSVPAAYTRWAEAGVIVRLVFALFIEDILSDKLFSSAERLALKHDAARIRTQEWLKRYAFPSELIEIFDASAMAELRGS